MLEKQPAHSWQLGGERLCCGILHLVCHLAVPPLPRCVSTWCWHVAPEVSPHFRNLCLYWRLGTPRVHPTQRTVRKISVHMSRVDQSV
jgi:hypothetical protein